MEKILKVYTRLVWKSVEDLLLTMTKEKEIHLSESLFTWNIEEYIRKLYDKLAVLALLVEDPTLKPLE